MAERTFVCEIYEDRPEMCKEYPKEDSYMPPSCSFFFPGDGTRQGTCDPECEAACCRVPRRNGEPLADYLDEISGGMPCKHLIEKEPS